MKLIEVQAAKEKGEPMNKIDFEQRCKVYTNALIAYGDKKQMIVALENGCGRSEDADV